MTERLARKERITKTRRRQILSAALAVFAERGYGESTMADVAGRAGVSVGTLYNYYRNKRDLLISLVKTTLISQDLVNMLNGMTGRNRRDIFNSLLEERLEFGFNNVQRMLFLFFEIQRDAKLRRQYVRQVLEPLLGRLEDMILREARNGTFRDVDEKIVARMMTGAIIGSMILYRLEQPNSPFKKAGLKSIAGEMGSLFLYGLEKR